MACEPAIIRDVRAAELILRGDIVEVYDVPRCGITPAQISAAVKFAEKSGKVAALVCEDCQPAEKYLVIRVIDLPLLLVLLYERLALEC